MCTHSIGVFNVVHLYNGAPLNGSPSYIARHLMVRDLRRGRHIPEGGAAPGARGAGAGPEGCGPPEFFLRFLVFGYGPQLTDWIRFEGCYPTGACVHTLRAAPV